MDRILFQPKTEFRWAVCNDKKVLQTRHVKGISRPDKYSLEQEILWSEWKNVPEVVLEQKKVLAHGDDYE